MSRKTANKKSTPKRLIVLVQQSGGAKRKFFPGTILRRTCAPPPPPAFKFVPAPLSFGWYLLCFAAVFAALIQLSASVTPLKLGVILTSDFYRFFVQHIVSLCNRRVTGQAVSGYFHQTSAESRRQTVRYRRKFPWYNGISSRDLSCIGPLIAVFDGYEGVMVTCSVS